MKKTIAIITLILLTAGCTKNTTTNSTSGSYTNVSCTELEQRAKSIIQNANHCDTDADCTQLSDFVQCPFGCSNLIHKSENISEFKKVTEQYKQQNCNNCVYKCGKSPTPDEIKCQNHKCVDSRYQK